MPENNFNNLPYAAWLEKTLRELIKFPVKGIALTALTTDGQAYSNYFNTTMADKLVISGIIQQDAMFDSMAANGMLEYVEDDEEGNSDGEEKE